MNKRYAILQGNLERPDVEKLRRAFQSVKCLTAADAPHLANDAFGILVKNLAEPDAIALHEALAAEGIPSEAVLQQNLPNLPPIKFVRRIDCEPESLVVYDPIGRKVPVEWGHVMLVAAGRVHTSDFSQQRQVRERPSLDASGLFFPAPESVETVVEYVSRETRNLKLFLEILLARSTMRFQMKADAMRFDYLAERRTGNDVEDLGAVLRDMQRFAPHLLLNRGAFFLRETPSRVFDYPSQNAFYEEITWMLWRAAQSGA